MGSDGSFTCRKQIPARGVRAVPRAVQSTNLQGQPQRRSVLFLPLVFSVLVHGLKQPRKMYVVDRTRRGLQWQNLSVFVLFLFISLIKRQRRTDVVLSILCGSYLGTYTFLGNNWTRTLGWETLSAGACASIPSLTMSPECRGLLTGYSASLFECQDNTSNLCSLNLCDKHAFIVDCGK